MPGVYISYPFCAQKCTYCNFASGAFSRDLEERYWLALRDEMARFEWPWVPDTVYLGGGTPSRVEPPVLGEALASIPGRPWREAALEVAPGCITPEIACGWLEAGFNRVSLGVQSFVQEEIRRAARRHTADVVEREVAILRENGLANFNIDLIAGLSGQTRPSWEESLDWIERLQPPHVSVYMLEVDEDSRLGQELILGGNRYGAGGVPPEEPIAEWYERAVERLGDMGILRYEISNFARPGYESVHNLKYWTLEPYIGFGADAHSFDGARRWQNVEMAADYVRLWEDGAPPRLPAEESDLVEEQFLVGLRLMLGITPAESGLARFRAPIQRFVREGLLEWHGSALRFTARGVMLSNEILQEFIGRDAA